jgi:heme A synthase
MVVHHFPAMTLFAFLVSVVFATLSKETLRDKALYGIKCFALFMIIAIALGWIMYFFPRH